MKHLETFQAEIAERGAMDGGMTDLFAQLKEGAKKTGTMVFSFFSFFPFLFLFVFLCVFFID